ncbi:hypothetical protein CC85DRAFT_286503 [Cutaneotrichosporon oleaginosum]|uniref:DH domain-containing protein n=1 Tax=Cutaneotrichosporon oleaginosum TaxID=879819 RepID=A0A0J1B1I4_9TREE|nr:uncharacterized protein CC85DRAFT_286503 [Cutaneotrichosporon oleaginosum]KLT41464.1 hypothetical protein CC85DRAFT_286503 [Cutaneotrichosporon oleaginosum]TXT12224.1 hypothetical protein COLE_02634 [Cutaneotrichosporon oleaginosum]
MPPLTAGSPFRRPRSRSRGPTARSPSPPPLPPKKSYIDLNSSSRSAVCEADCKPLRAFLSDVVVIGPETNETTALLSQLGNVVERPTAIPRPKPQVSTISPSAGELCASRAEELEKLLRGRIEELVRTERSYVSRIKALKVAYADPLRHFAKSSNTSIIPVYEAKTLFGNIDAVLPAALTFLSDLESMWDSGDADKNVGDVCLKHLKTLKTLDCYRTYIANQDEAQKTFNEMKRKHSRFVTFIDSTKYQTTGIGNIGLFELLMEPVQRIPRYILLWEEMVKYMSVLSPQRAKLLEAKDVASRIARCEPDERTVRATVMYSLERNVDGFPASLFSNNRDYLDSIDAEDVTTDGVIFNPRASRPVSIKSGKSSTVTSLGSLASNHSFASPQKEMGAPPPLHCTLFLFDDKLMIAKRQATAISGRKATGVDDIKDLIKSGGGVAVKEKDGARRAKLCFRGVVDILDVRVADVGKGDFQLFFEQPLADQGDRWNLPLRFFQVCHPPAPVGLDLQAARTDKIRFVQNIWAAQALARSKTLPSQPKSLPYILASEETYEVEGERVKPYWNVWTLPGWSAEQRKAKVLIEVVGTDCGDLPLPEQDDSISLVIRLEPLAGDLCRVSHAPKKGQAVVRELISSGDVNKTVVEKISHAMVYVLPSNNPNPLMQTPTLSKRASRFLLGTASTNSRGGHSDGFSSTSTHGLSLTSRSSGMDTGTLSGVDTISSAGHSLTHASPSSPRSPMSPTTPSSPPWSPVRSRGAPPAMEDCSDDRLASRLDEARNNSRSLAAMASPRPTPHSPTGPSRVTIMRQQLEARERQAKAAAEEDREKTRSSPLKPGVTPSKRVPVPTLASSITESISRDSSLGSLPQSPTKSGLPRAGTLSRSGTVSPRGPRQPPGRSGYVAPFPPPVPTAEKSVSAPPAAIETLLDDVKAENEAAEGPPHAPERTLLLSATGPIASETAPARRPLPIPQGPAAPPPPVSRLMGLGAAPKLRSISSGRGSLTHDENIPPATQKRAHPAEHLSPRKRTPSDSVMSRAESDMTPTQGHTPRYPSSLGASGSRQSSICSSKRVLTPRSDRRGSGVLTPSKRVSSVASVASVQSSVSTATVGSVDTLKSAAEQLDVVMSDHPDLASAADAAWQTISDARRQARAVRKTAAALSKPLKDRHRSRFERQASLARSPHSRNIHAELNSPTDEIGFSTTVPLTDPMEDQLKLLASNTRAVEERLAVALADTERVRMLARNAPSPDLLSHLQGQVGRAKEREELLRSQLEAKGLEVDEIYNAFNAELDGMYNDISLSTPDEVQAALRKDLQAAKWRRNELALDNQRLRDELAKERLRREQMAALLRSAGGPTASVVQEDATLEA